MSSKMIVDTSIWIEYFKNNPDVVKVVETGLIDGTVYIMGPIISELLQGAKTQPEFEKLRQCIDAVPYLECTIEDWLRAGKISFALRKAGITVPLTDTLIASVALNRHVEVFTLDKHFSYIPEVQLVKE